MELAELIALLSDPAAYPVPVESIDVRQTHISVVFLAGEHVYKIKKPVNLGFLDFSTLAKRRHFCEEEVRLNARLAGDVYEGVVPIVQSGAQLRFEGPGEAVEWAVKMKRLADDATLESRLARGAVTVELVEQVARRIAAFHAAAETNERIAAFGRFDVVARNARENLELAQPHVGQALSRAVFDRLQSRLDEVLADQRSLIDARAARGVTRDTHGDLRLDHVYVFDAVGGPPEMVIIDCIEFNEHYRFADPVSDTAFLVMDLKYDGRGDLARVLADAYFAASGDEEGRPLLPLYTSYRAAVRGKVEGFRQAEAEVPEAERAEAREHGRGYWLLALGELEPPQHKPCLVLVGGLPGAGKSTLSAELAARAGFQVIRSDAVRKSLPGASDEPARAAFGRGLYSAEWNERTYEACLDEAEQMLFDGQRVIVDASFREDARRRAFVAAARRWKVPVVVLVCQADEEVTRGRLAKRSGDVSDADWDIYLQAARVWEPPGAEVQAVAHTIATAGTPEQAGDAALAALRAAGIAG